MKILVTGVAGFIGMHTAQRLLARGDEVIGIDNLNDYYDPALKRDRLASLQVHAGFRFERNDVSDRAAVQRLFADHGFERVVHQAVQASVRHSLVDPHAYVRSDLVGFINILDARRQQAVQHLV